MRCPDGVCVTSPLTRTNCGCITIDPAEISAIVATYGYLNPSTLCAYFSSMANAGDATPGITELVGVDCQRYTLPISSVTVSDTTTIDLTQTGNNIEGDVIISPNAGNVLIDDGSGLYVPSATFNCSDLNTCSIDDLGDVDTASTPPNPGDVLTWDGISWTPQVASSSGFTSGVRATKVGALAVGFTAFVNITGWAEAYDGLGEFDPVTGIFTPLVSGRYLIAYNIQWNPASNTTGQHQTFILKNGLIMNPAGDFATNAVGVNAHAHAILNLTAGDVVRLQGRVDFGNGTGGTIAALALSGGGTGTQIHIQRLL